MVEKAPYSIVGKKGAIELRDYPEMILAVVDSLDDNSAFGLLFNYISGENNMNNKIKMTAPVISPTKIPMTAPVISTENSMAFVLPASYTKDTVPTPVNPRVRIKVQPKKRLAVLRFSGRTPDAKVEHMTQQLLNHLSNQHIKIKGSPFLMRYNSPFAPGFIRRNEVAVEIIDDSQ